jgi:PD-(D/E)XK nuclease superfamily
MLGLINTLTPSHIIESEAESGGGRADIVLIPHNGKGDQAIIIEYKVSKKKEDLALMARTGLEQIIDKRYDLKIKQHPHVKKILKIAMAFCGKEMDLQYQVDAI